MRTMIGGFVMTLAVLVALPLAQGGRKVHGVVVAAATGRPVANARVKYEEQGRAGQTAVTDAKGYFEFPIGNLGVVTVTSRGFGTARRRWPPRQGLQLRVPLRPPASLSGTVTDMATRGSVAALVTVTVRHPSDVVSDMVLAENGTFQFDDLPPGPAVVLARAAGYAPSIGAVTVEAGKVRDARVGLLLEAVATGYVEDRRGSPVAGAWVSASYPDTTAGAGQLQSFIGGRPLTGPDGAFTLNGLVPDTPISLQAEIDDRRSEVVTVTVGPGMMQQNVVLRLP